jgi:ribonuclease T1
MASGRKPGPVGAEGMVPDIQDGTLVRAASPTPGPVGPHGKSVAAATHAAPHRPRKSYAGLPTLRKGAHNKHVRWLQVLLNRHNAAHPPLKVDGYFGPKTLAATINFQRSVRLFPDGVVGKQTWLKLVATEKVSPQRTTQTATQAAPQPAVAKAGTPTPVADWSLSHRFEEVLKLAPNHMAPDLAAQFRAMLTPESIAIIVGTLAIWAVSHAFGAGEVFDLVLLVVGSAFMGLAAFRAGEDIGECLMTTLNAETQADLDKAADCLAQAVAILGVVAFFSLIAKVATKFGGAASGGEEDAGAASRAGGGEGDVSKVPESEAPEDVPDDVDYSRVPASSRGRVSETLANIEKRDLPYSRDGITFGNREGLLPAKPEGYYKEYTVSPAEGAKGRGAERLVVGGNGEVYYTPDHYGSFTRIQ